MVNLRPQDPLPPLTLDDKPLPKITLDDRPLGEPGAGTLRLPSPPRERVGPAPAPTKLSPIATPTPAEPKPRPEYRQHVADNALDDAIFLGKELVLGIGHLLGTAGGYIFDPAQYLKDVKLLFKGKGGVWGDIGNVFKDGLVENYKNDEGQVALLDAITKRPFHTAADIAGLSALLGGGLKLAGKAAGTGARAQQLAKVGEALAKTGQRLDPISGTATLIGKGVTKTGVGRQLGDWLGVGEHTKDYLKIKAHESAAEEALEHGDKLKLAAKHLTPQDVEALERRIRRGSVEDREGLSPAARKWAEVWSDVAGEQEQKLVQEKVGLTGERRTRANAIAAARANWRDEFVKASEGQRENMIRLAAHKIDTREWQPLFASMFAPDDKKGIIDLLTGQYQKSRNYGRLNNRTGLGDYEKDITKVAMRQVEQYHNIMAKLRTFKRLMSVLSRKGVVKPLKDASQLPEGYAIVDYPLLLRYLEVKNKAASELVSRAMRAGEVTPESVLETVETIIAHPALREPVKESGKFAVPRHVARLIDMDMGAPTGPGIVYDRLMSYWKSMATVLRPAAWVATAVGNGIMDLLHGIGFDDIRRSRKLAGLFPPEIGSKIGARLTEGDNLFEKVSNTLGAYYSKLDELLVRGPAFAKEVEEIRRKIVAELKETGAHFFAAREILEDPDKFAQMVAAGPEALSVADRELQRIYEDSAGRVPELVKLRRERAGAAGALRKLEAAYHELLDQMSGQQTVQSESVLRQQIRTLQERAADIRRQLPELAAKETAEGKIAVGGKRKLENALKRAIMQQEREALRDMVEILKDIRTRGGVRPIATGESIPRGLRSPRGVPAGELADELYNRGIIPVDTEDALAEFLTQAQDTIRGYREARVELLKRAKREAASRVREAVKELTRNAKQQATLRARLHTYERQRIISEGDLVKAQTERGRRAIALEDELEKAHAALVKADTAYKSMLADTVEDLVKSGQIRQQLPELQKIAAWADEGIEAGNRLAGSYARLHPVERLVFRRGVPFYNYTKAMTLLLPKIPFLYGSRVFLWSRMSRILMDLHSDPTTPEWLSDYVPVAVADDGGIYFLPMRAMMPWGGVRTAEAGNLSIPSIADVASQNPIVKMAFELKGGVPEWSKRPWSVGDRMTRVDTGEVYELARGGRVRKTIAQPSVWKSLWNLFPTTQLLETLFQPYAQTDEGWLLSPSPITKPDGTPMFPVDLMERMGKVLGMGVRKVNTAEESRREANRERRVLRSFQKQVRRLPPDEREAARQVLRDWLLERQDRRGGSR